MNFMGGLLGVLFFLAYIGVAIWILVSFYRALARISEELNEIAHILRDRLPRPGPGAPR